MVRELVLTHPLNRLFGALRYCGAKEDWYSQISQDGMRGIAQAFLDDSMLARAEEWPPGVIVGPVQCDPRLKLQFLDRLQECGVSRDRMILVARTMPWAHAVVAAMRKAVGTSVC